MFSQKSEGETSTWQASKHIFRHTLKWCDSGRKLKKAVLLHNRSQEDVRKLRSKSNQQSMSQRPQGTWRARQWRCEAYTRACQVSPDNYLKKETVPHSWNFRLLSDSLVLNCGGTLTLYLQASLIWTDVHPHLPSPSFTEHHQDCCCYQSNQTHHTI